MDQPPSRKVLGSFVHDEYGRKYIIMEWTIEMKTILIKMIKVILIKHINRNKYSNEINNVNDIIRNKRKKEINIMLLLIKVKTRSIYQINCANQ